MKKLYILFILLSSFAFAQIPSNYYDTANGLTGFTLKTKLRDIVTAGHVARTYDQLYDGVGITGSQGYIDTHSDVMTSSGNQYENDGTILDMYSENPTGADPYNFTHNVENSTSQQMAESDCYNREHLVPQSSFSEAFPMRSDIHHVIPTDCRVNNFRGSLPFGNVATANWTSLNGSKRGSSGVTGYSGVMFEPIDEFKGDIARALLYFAVRYQDDVDTFTSFDMFDGTEDQVFESWAINVLLDWHNNVDPVDQRERDRNNEAYKFQGNANPFVDHPEYVNMIWTSSATDTEAPSTPTNLMTSNPTATSIDLSWTASTDNIAVTTYDIYVDGSFNRTTNSNATTFTVTGLTPNTTYSFTILAKDAVNNASALSSAANGTTLSGMTTSNELFFSEYLEGSGDNKALEIANFTGAAITNLSDYEIRLSSNGNSTWTEMYSFTASASIADEDVYVISNGSLNVCTGVVDNQNNAITSFNGNDAIGLFKNGVLIDVIGTLGDDTEYAENTTLVRNANISGGNTAFDINEWSSSPSNTCTDLGSHMQTLSLANNSLKSIKLFPNPVSGNTIEINYNNNLFVEIFDILGKKVKQLNLVTTDKKIDISRLKKGIYLLRLKTNNGTITKKLIRQ